MTGTKFTVDKLETGTARFENLRIMIGKVIEEEEEWEKMGPHPKPQVTTLRDWDKTILKRYVPFYTPVCDLCCLCTYGKCDLTKGKRGACGIDIQTQQARFFLLTTVIGASCHAAHARHLLEQLIEKYGRRHPVSLGSEVDVEAPITRLVVGLKPKTLADFEEVLDYIENQLVHLMAATHTGQEGDASDFESKSFHAGMLDNLALEVGDLTQIVAYGFPKGAADAPLVELGMGTIDTSKPLILCVGHNVAAGVEVIDTLRDKGVQESLEVCGICCTAQDLVRYYDKAKIIGPTSRQMKFVRSGLADVIIVDEQCVRTDILEEAKKVKTVVISTLDKICLGLPDMTQAPTAQIVGDLVSGKMPGAFIQDPYKASEVAVEVALVIAPKRADVKAFIPEEEFKSWIQKCNLCGMCRRACPQDLTVDEAFGSAKKGSTSDLTSVYEFCKGCLLCESGCPQDIPIVKVMQKAAEKNITEERFKIRSGRGPIKDTEIRVVGPPIVFGEIPGVIAFAGCSNYPGSSKDVAKMAEEYLKRNFIVTASGCSAMDLGFYRDEEGQTLYEKYPGDFDMASLSNVGSCVSNSHIIGAAVKIANLFAHRPLRGNFEEIADYIYNRLGAVAIVWGAQTQKAQAIGTGANRLGIPVILGPHGAKYRRLLLGRRDVKEDWMVYDARTGDKVYGGPAPEHLLYVAETIEEAIVMGAKLCIRPNDTGRGRQIKLTHYIDLYKRYYNAMPDDVHLFIRNEGDIPMFMKEEILPILKEKGWSEVRIPDPTLLKRQIKVKPAGAPTGGR